MCFTLGDQPGFPNCTISISAEQETGQDKEPETESGLCLAPKFPGQPQNTDLGT